MCPGLYVISCSWGLTIIQYKITSLERYFLTLYMLKDLHTESPYRDRVLMLEKKNIYHKNVKAAPHIWILACNMWYAYVMYVTLKILLHM